MGIKHRIFLWLKPMFLQGYKWMGVEQYAKKHTVDLECLPESINYCLVLGAKVEYTMTTVLEQRLQAVIALAKVRPKMIFVLSGTPRHNQYPSDVAMMQEYLLANSTITQEQLRLDYEGFTTWKSFKEWKRQGLPREFGVITNYFHLPRALYCGQKLDLHPYGIRLPRLIGPSQKYYLDRELAATYKVWLQRLIG